MTRVIAFLIMLVVLITSLFIANTVMNQAGKEAPNITHIGTPVELHINDYNVVGIWRDTLSTGSSVTFNFNNDFTGDVYLDGAVFGNFRLSQKTYFKYRIDNAYIYLNNIRPELMGGGFDKTLKYEVISKNKIMIGNAVFEKRLW